MIAGLDGGMHSTEGLLVYYNLLSVFSVDNRDGKSWCFTIYISC